MPAHISPSTYTALAAISTKIAKIAQKTRIFVFIVAPPLWSTSRRCVRAGKFMRCRTRAGTKSGNLCQQRWLERWNTTRRVQAALPAACFLLFWDVRDPVIYAQKFLSSRSLVYIFLSNSFLSPTPSSTLLTLRSPPGHSRSKFLTFQEIPLRREKQPFSLRQGHSSMQRSYSSILKT